MVRPEETWTKEYPCPVCECDVEVAVEDDARVTCPECGARLLLNVDADGDSEGYRDASTLSVDGRMHMEAKMLRAGTPHDWWDYEYTASDGSVWHIRETCPPIPTRKFDWAWVHSEYDGPGDHRHGDAETRDACVAEIEEWVRENGPVDRQGTGGDNA